ncbi:MAG: hypothetical protein IPK21_00495 [Haliscomenobacter sp.]|nr:hypothetical protein [Haliscomenobacter sp.]
MTTKQIYFVIAASCLALLGLIAIQVRWMTYSQELLEEQFEHRVDMALCQAVETTTNEPCCGPAGTGSATPIKGLPRRRRYGEHDPQRLPTAAQPE